MELVRDSKAAATITWIAGVVAVIVSCALPATFFVNSYRLQQAVIDTEAEINSRIASQVINANPTLWRYQQLKLEEFLSRRPHQGGHEIRRIVDLEGKIIAESADPIAAPSLWRSRKVLDSGVEVGEIQIGRSLRPLLYQTAGVGLVAAILALCAFVAMRTLPLGALDRALAENTKLVEESKRAEAVQKFLKELSQDIVSLNIDSLLIKFTEKVREFFNVRAADVRIIEKGAWKVKSVSGIEPEKLQSDNTGTNRGRSGWILQNRKPLFIPDIIKQTGFPGGESLLKVGIRGYAGLPLFSKSGEVMGILRALSYAPREFSESEIDLLQQLANGTAIALTNARLYDETERRRREAEELARVGRSLTAILDMAAVGERIVTSVQELLGVKASTLRILQPDGSLRVLASAGEVFPKSSGEDVLVAGIGFVSVAVTEGRPIWSADTLNEPGIRLTDQMRDYQLRSGDRSRMVVPLRAHETIIGSLALADRTGRIYSESEVTLAQMFADQAALALENARLFEEAKQGAQDQEALSAIATTVNRSLHLNEILETTMDRVLMITGRERVSIRLKNPVTGEVTLSAHRGFSREEIEDLRRRVPHKASEQVLASGEALIIDATAVGTEPGSLLAQSRIVAWIPIKARANVVGVIGIASTAPIPFSPREVGSLEAIGNVIGVAIVNARLFEEVTASKGELEKLNNALAHQANDLQRSNAELEQFAYVASHDLQEPLRMVSGYMQLFAKRYQGKLDQDADEFIGQAVNGAKRMQGLIHDLLVYSRVGTQGKEFAPTDCGAVVAETLRLLQPAIEESAATITHDPLPTVMGDESQLLQLFQNLIGNAIKYQDGKPPVVRVSCKQEGGSWLFSVRDNGIGLDPQYANKIFVIFQRLHGRDQYAGTGIGLAVCKKIVERHGGRIWVESELGKGATFQFTIPLHSGSEGAKYAAGASMAN